jgi:hypothetical protein
MEACRDDAGARAIYNRLLDALIPNSDADVVDGDVRCRRWQPKDEFAEMVWAIVPGTFKPSAGDDGVFAAQVDLVELLWYGAP